MEKNQVRYRIHRENGRIKYAGTGFSSWFSLEDARKLAEPNESVYEYCMQTMDPLWEIL